MSYIASESLKKKACSLWAEIEDKPLKTKERLALPQQEMPSQEPTARGKNMEEVALGYTPEQVRIEASRCLQCKNAPCVAGCPVSIDIPGFLAEAAKGDFQASVDIIKKTSLLPSICGRVCPQERQCMERCTVGKSLKDPMQAVAIGRVERFVADWEHAKGSVKLPEQAPATGKKVGVIGSGPAGLTVAADLARLGHQVTLFEAFPKAGGVMIYGIPEFRLPKAIVEEEIQNLMKMGVEIRYNFLVGRTRKLNDLMKKDGYDALFIGTGAGLPRFMSIEGENLMGVFSANEYLTRANLMRGYDKKNADTPLFESKKVAVLGGGNVAMDAARMALRLGAETVYIVYRRTEKEMPARREEVEHAQEEGIEFLLLTNPKRILGDEQGQVRGLECLHFKLGEPDDSGRQRPVPVEGSEFEMEVDTVIPALGNLSNPLIRHTSEGLEFNKRGNILVDENNATSIPGIYAGGDIVLGAATVILAMGEGRRAARSIDAYLNKGE